MSAMWKIRKDRIMTRDRLYANTCWYVARCLTKIGIKLCKVWPWAALRFSSIGLKLYIHAVKFRKEHLNG